MKIPNVVTGNARAARCLNPNRTKPDTSDTASLPHIRSRLCSRACQDGLRKPSWLPCRSDIQAQPLPEPSQGGRGSGGGSWPYPAASLYHDANNIADKPATPDERGELPNLNPVVHPSPPNANARSAGRRAQIIQVPYLVLPYVRRCQ